MNEQNHTQVTAVHTVAIISVILISNGNFHGRPHITQPQMIPTMKPETAHRTNAMSQADLL